MKTDLLKPRPKTDLRINLRLHGKTAQAVKECMAEMDVDAPTAVRILISQAKRDGNRVA